jgi:hypothetical protein
MYIVFINYLYISVSIDERVADLDVSSVVVAVCSLFFLSCLEELLPKLRTALNFFENDLTSLAGMMN